MNASQEMDLWSRMRQDPCAPFRLSVGKTAPKQIFMKLGGNGQIQMMINFWIEMISQGHTYGHGHNIS